MRLKIILSHFFENNLGKRVKRPPYIYRGHTKYSHSVKGVQNESDFQKHGSGLFGQV